MSSARRLLLASVSLACLLPFAASAADPAISREQFSAMLKQTLDENPEIIMDAIKKLQSKQQEDGNKIAADSIGKNKDDLFNNPNAGSAGASAKDADITIVEFFDYHCGYCKHMLAPLTQLINTDKKVRVVFIDFPILSQDSANAARAAVAVNRINKKKYFDFYTAAMQESGKFDETTIENIARKIDIDPDKLKAEMAKKEVGDILQKNRSLGETMAIHGTPALIINDQFFPGALSLDELQRAIDAARKAKKG